MSDSSGNVTFTSLFLYWVEPSQGESVHKLPAQDSSLPALRRETPEGSESSQFPGQNDGQWGQ